MDSSLLWIPQCNESGRLFFINSHTNAVQPSFPFSEPSSNEKGTKIGSDRDHLGPFTYKNINLEKANATFNNLYKNKTSRKSLDLDSNVNSIRRATARTVSLYLLEKQRKILMFQSLNFPLSSRNYFAAIDLASIPQVTLLNIDCNHYLKKNIPVETSLQCCLDKPSWSQLLQNVIDNSNNVADLIFKTIKTIDFYCDSEFNLNFNSNSNSNSNLLDDTIKIEYINPDNLTQAWECFIDSLLALLLAAGCPALAPPAPSSYLSTSYNTLLSALLLFSVLFRSTWTLTVDLLEKSGKFDTLKYGSSISRVDSEVRAHLRSNLSSTKLKTNELQNAIKNFVKEAKHTMVISDIDLEENNFSDQSLSNKTSNLYPPKSSSTHTSTSSSFSSSSSHEPKRDDPLDIKSKISTLKQQNTDKILLPGLKPGIVICHDSNPNSEKKNSDASTFDLQNDSFSQNQDSFSKLNQINPQTMNSSILTSTNKLDSELLETVDSQKILILTLISQLQTITSAAKRFRKIKKSHSHSNSCSQHNSTGIDNKTKATSSVETSSIDNSDEIYSQLQEIGYKNHYDAQRSTHTSTERFSSSSDHDSKTINNNYSPHEHKHHHHHHNSETENKDENIIYDSVEFREDPRAFSKRTTENVKSIVNAVRNFIFILDKLHLSHNIPQQPSNTDQSSLQKPIQNSLVFEKFSTKLIPLKRQLYDQLALLVLRTQGVISDLSYSLDHFDDEDDEDEDEEDEDEENSKTLSNDNDKKPCATKLNEDNKNHKNSETVENRDESPNDCQNPKQKSLKRLMDNYLMFGTQFFDRADVYSLQLSSRRPAKDLSRSAICKRVSFELDSLIQVLNETVRLIEHTVYLVHEIVDLFAATKNELKREADLNNSTDLLNNSSKENTIYSTNNSNDNTKSFATKLDSDLGQGTQNNLEIPQINIPFDKSDASAGQNIAKSDISHKKISKRASAYLSHSELCTSPSNDNLGQSLKRNRSSFQLDSLRNISQELSSKPLNNSVLLSTQKERTSKNWYLKFDHSDEIIFDSKGRVRGGTPIALVEYLTSHKTYDAKFNSTFLLIFRFFMSPSVLLSYLVSRFSIQPPEGLTQKEFEIWAELKQKPIRIRVFNVIKLWLENYWFEEDVEVFLRSAHSSSIISFNSTNNPFRMTSGGNNLPHKEKHHNSSISSTFSYSPLNSIPALHHNSVATLNSSMSSLSFSSASTWSTERLLESMAAFALSLKQQNFPGASILIGYIQDRQKGKEIKKKNNSIVSPQAPSSSQLPVAAPLNTEQYNNILTASYGISNPSSIHASPASFIKTLRTSASFLSDAPKVSRSFYSNPSVTQLDPEELAKQITYHTAMIFSRIKPIELMHKAWTEYYRNHLRHPEEYISAASSALGARSSSTGSVTFSVPVSDAANVRALINSSNRMSCWVSETILKPSDPKKRAKIIVIWIRAAEHCWKLQNYDSVMSIISALYSSVIYRLKFSWSHVDKREIAVRDNLFQILNASKNFSRYRELVKSVSPPMIPFIGVFLSDLTFVEDGNPDIITVMKSSGDAHPKEIPAEYLKHQPHQIQKSSEFGIGSLNTFTVINFSKMMKLADIIHEVLHTQVLSYQIMSIPEIQAWIDVELEVSQHMDELYEISVQREPRRNKGDTITLLEELSL